MGLASELIDRIRYRSLLHPVRTRRHGQVGPAALWKMKRQFQIDFLRQVGLAPHHYLLDLGCGTLRGGLPIIEYLETGHYYGVEARRHILEDGRRELAGTRLQHKKPVLVLSDSLDELDLAPRFDFVWAFAVLFLLADDVLEAAFRGVKRHLAEDGAFFATVKGDCVTDHEWKGFPVLYRSLDVYREVAERHRLDMSDVGDLWSLGHRTGKPPDQHRMLCFRHVA
jgi:SAM-dependent methyltransferase